MATHTIALAATAAAVLSVAVEGQTWHAEWAADPSTGFSAGPVRGGVSSCDLSRDRCRSTPGCAWSTASGYCFQATTAKFDEEDYNMAVHRVTRPVAAIRSEATFDDHEQSNRKYVRNSSMRFEDVEELLEELDDLMIDGAPSAYSPKFQACMDKCVGSNGMIKSLWCRAQCTFGPSGFGSQ